MSNSFATPWTVAHQAPLSTGFPRQEYWNGLPCSSPGNLPHPGIEPMPPALADKFFTTEPRVFLDCKEIQPVNPKGNQLWIFSGRTDAEAETPILWPPDVKNWLTGKDPEAGKHWRQEETGTTEDEMVGWHHWLDGHEFE